MKCVEGGLREAARGFWEVTAGVLLRDGLQELVNHVLLRGEGGAVSRGDASKGAQRSD